ncbi:GtrA family protein [Aquipuribacter nitratireducens]|uniref:GtrA family protein n=1 Tax=Aquipuribacter nitratireducens TaxID=650104 RepID=A0ABW0GR03_9MICO
MTTARTTTDSQEATASWLSRVQRHSLTRFLAFSAFGLAFDLTVLALLDAFTPLPRLASVAIAFVLTYALNFVLNRWYAFDAAHGHAGAQVSRFLPQVAADFLLVLFGVQLLLLTGMPLLVARVLSASTNAVLNYCAYRWWTFRDALPGRSADGSAP